VDDEKIISQHRPALIKMKMPGFAPGIFRLEARCQKTGIIPAYKKTTEEDSTWRVWHW
jgi:hypothetical protein